jgi:hypothetical protein
MLFAGGLNRAVVEMSNVNFDGLFAASGKGLRRLDIRKNSCRFERQE